VANVSNPFFIGCRRSSDWYFNGGMSEVAFYSYALSQSQLLNHVTVGQPNRLAITPSTIVIADSNPSNVPKDGINDGATWVASDSGRSGVMRFDATNANELRVVAYPELAQTNLTIMFWMRSTGVVTSAQGGGGGG
jgi:sugar lactone lactonase YvrE